MEVKIPELALVVLVGPSGSGKSTLARTLFKPTEVISSDFCRGLVSDDENSQAATNDAFEVLHFIAAKRLRAGKLTVIEARKSLISLAREYHCLPVALVLDFPERLCRDRNAGRADRNFGDHVIRNQCSQLRKSLRSLEREGFRHVTIFHSPEDLVGLTIRREPLWNNKKSEAGPFDIIGDIHGCLDEALELLASLGYTVGDEGGRYSVNHPHGRKIVFVGDLVDRGPNSPGVIRLVMDAVASGAAFCVAGNHDVKLSRALRGRDVKLTHGLAESLEQLKQETDEFRKVAADYLDGLVSHYVFNDGRLVVAHAGLREEMHGRGSGAVRQFAMYGETTGETDEYGCVASSTSGQNASVEMRDFELLRTPRRRSEVDEQTRTSTIYGRTETRDFEGGGSAWRDRERGVPAPCLGGVGILSLAGGGPGRLGGGAEARRPAHATQG
jgi:protein phosphatase